MGRSPSVGYVAAGGFGEAVQPRVESLYEPGAVLDAAGGAFQWRGEAPVGFTEDDFGESAVAVASGRAATWSRTMAALGLYWAAS